MTATPNLKEPWGEGAITLEWYLPSPPPFHSWQQPPGIFVEVAGGPARPAGRGEPGCLGVILSRPWNPPTSESERARQRILAVVVAFILAGFLAQVGW